MIVTSEGIVDGKILDIYGKRSRYMKMGMPFHSLPLLITEVPQYTQTFAIVFDDPDSVPVVGFVWIHWLVANLRRNRLRENESIESYDFIQGKNSWGENCYGGPNPPNAPHNYRLTVYAIDCKLDLRGDFTLEHLQKAMEGHVLDTATIFGSYSN